MNTILRLCLFAGVLCVGSMTRAVAQAAQTIEIAEGVLAFYAPDAWSSVSPRNNLIERELAVSPAEGVEASPARLTVMAAGGSVEANLARWAGQFRGTEGGADQTGSAIEKLEAGGMPVTFIDRSGTFIDSPRGPFGPKTPREGYRMLGAIVQTPDSGNYFFKLVGPEATVDPAVEAFRAMVLSIRKK